MGFYLGFDQVVVVFQVDLGGLVFYVGVESGFVLGFEGRVSQDQGLFCFEFFYNKLMDSCQLVCLVFICQWLFGCYFFDVGFGVEIIFIVKGQIGGFSKLLANG